MIDNLQPGLAENWDGDQGRSCKKIGEVAEKNASALYEDKDAKLCAFQEDKLPFEEYGDGICTIHDR